jgi:hypothetical protein
LVCESDEDGKDAAGCFPHEADALACYAMAGSGRNPRYADEAGAWMRCTVRHRINHQEAQGLWPRVYANNRRAVLLTGVLE